MVELRLESNGVEARTGGDLKFSRTFLKLVLTQLQIRGKFVLQHFKCKDKSCLVRLYD